MQKKPTTAGLCRELGEVKQRLNDHIENHEKDHAERIERQHELDRRLAGMQESIDEILNIKRSTEIMLRVAKWLFGAGITITGAIKVIAGLKGKQ